MQRTLTKVNDLELTLQPSGVAIELVQGDPQIQAHLVHATSTLSAGFATAQPAIFEYVLETDEIVHVLEGRAAITLDSGETVELAAGDTVVLPKGSRSRWTVTAPLKEFFVLGY